MHKLVACLALLTIATGCAGFLQFLDRSGRDIAEAVLECVPAIADPSPEQAAACFGSSVDAVDSALESAPVQQGATVIECAHALREVDQLEREGQDATEAKARAQALVEQLSPAE